MGVLYVVATPIGNLEDITLRALRVLGEVGLIAAEDTRTTRKLLNHYGIKTPLTSYHEHNRQAKIPFLVEALETMDVALVSEAGVPGISDPGRELVLEAVQAGALIRPVPGASALTAALAVSGLPVEGSLFLGFLPRRKGERRKLLESIASLSYTLVAFEAPHRLRSCLADALDVLGDRSVVVCRELTKLYEEIFRGPISEALGYFQQPKGEFCLVVEGATCTMPTADDGWVTSELQRLRAQGLKAKEAVATVGAASGRSHRELYRLWLESSRGTTGGDSP